MGLLIEQSVELEDPLHEDVPLRRLPPKVGPALRTVRQVTPAIAAHHVVALLTAEDAGGWQLQAHRALQFLALLQGGEVWFRDSSSSLFLMLLPQCLLGILNVLRQGSYFRL